MTPAVSRHLIHLARRVIPVATAAAGALAVIVAVIALLLLVFPPDTTINVVAQTEQIVMRINHQLPWRWTFEDATLRHGTHEGAFSGSLQLGFPVEVAMERVGLGALWISVRHQRGQDPHCKAATLFGPDEGALPPVPCEFDVLVSGIKERAARGQTTVLTLEGEISAGRPVGFETQGTGTALLRSGRVTLREKTWFRDTRYDASTNDLEAGDFLRVGQVNPEINATGFAVVDERPAMTAAFRVAGRAATIERPGGGESALTTDIFSRFKNNKVLQALTATIVALVGLVTMSAAIVEGLNHEPEVPAADRSTTTSA